MKMNATTCQEYLSPKSRYEMFSQRRCGRPIYAAASGLCKLHASVEARAAAKREEERVAMDSSNNIYQQIADFLAETGIKGHAEWRPSTRSCRAGSTGRVVVDLDTLRDLVAAAKAGAR